MGVSTTVEPHRSKGSVPTIAVVDDDPAVRRALTRLLKSAGYQVVAFPSGEELIAAFELIRPTGMVIDLHLAGMSGTDLVEQISRRGALPPTIFITGHLDAWKLLEEPKHLGLACLKKPFDDAVLLSLLDRALARPPRDTGD
jgi:FixJ family two-component response regulator